MPEMTDYATPAFSGMIVEWLNQLPMPEVDAFLQRVGVHGDRRDGYLAFLRGEDVEFDRAEPEVFGEVIDITPTMAIKATRNPGTMGIPIINWQGRNA